MDPETATRRSRRRTIARPVRARPVSASCRRTSRGSFRLGREHATEAAASARSSPPGEPGARDPGLGAWDPSIRRARQRPIGTSSGTGSVEMREQRGRRVVVSSFASSCRPRLRAPGRETHAATRPGRTSRPAPRRPTQESRVRFHALRPHGNDGGVGAGTVTPYPQDERSLALAEQRGGDWALTSRFVSMRCPPG
jgi:hypothetical protein